MESSNNFPLVYLKNYDLERQDLMHQFDCMNIVRRKMFLDGTKLLSNFLLDTKIDIVIWTKIETYFLVNGYCRTLF